MAGCLYVELGAWGWGIELGALEWAQGGGREEGGRIEC